MQDLVRGKEQEQYKMYHGAKTFSATQYKARETLGDDVTAWIRENPQYKIVDKKVTQSSDSEYHCLSITLFYTIL